MPSSLNDTLWTFFWWPLRLREGPELSQQLSSEPHASQMVMAFF